jgi:uncharacterized surface protein with fasciclin (FAS1) repeats
MIASHLLFLLSASLFCLASHGFQLQPIGTTTTTRRPSLSILKSSNDKGERAVSDNEALLKVKNFLKENYPGFNAILEKNDSVWKALAGVDEGGFTIFAPSAAALTALGEKKQSQLLDIRNLETSQKLGAYHVIAETVTADELFNAGGVISLGGEIVIERSRSGGFMGVGGKEDGGVTINGAKVVKTIDLQYGLVHEVDALVSPNILWRYMDQLRIPGSN